MKKVLTTSFLAVFALALAPGVGLAASSSTNLDSEFAAATHAPPSSHHRLSKKTATIIAGLAAGSTVIVVSGIAFKMFKPVYAEEAARLLRKRQAGELWTEQETNLMNKLVPIDSPGYKEMEAEFKERKAAADRAGKGIKERARAEAEDAGADTGAGAGADAGATVKPGLTPRFKPPDLGGQIKSKVVTFERGKIHPKDVTQTETTKFKDGKTEVKTTEYRDGKWSSTKITETDALENTTVVSHEIPGVGEQRLQIQGGKGYKAPTGTDVPEVPEVPDVPGVSDALAPLRANNPGADDPLRANNPGADDPWAGPKKPAQWRKLTDNDSKVSTSGTQGEVSTAAEQAEADRLAAGGDVTPGGIGDAPGGVNVVAGEAGAAAEAGAGLGEGGEAGVEVVAGLVGDAGG